VWAFVDSVDEDGVQAYGVFCEDDIYIRRDFSTSIQIAIDAYERTRADVMLLGYLLPAKAVTTHVCPGHELPVSLCEASKIQSEVGSGIIFLVGFQRVFCPRFSSF
jgi:hypothetical protein